MDCGNNTAIMGMFYVTNRYFAFYGEQFNQYILVRFLPPSLIFLFHDPSSDLFIFLQSVHAAPLDDQEHPKRILSKVATWISSNVAQDRHTRRRRSPCHPFSCHPNTCRSSCSSPCPSASSCTLPQARVALDFH